MMGTPPSSVSPHGLRSSFPSSFSCGLQDAAAAVAPGETFVFGAREEAGQPEHSPKPWAEDQAEDRAYSEGESVPRRTRSCNA